MMAQGFAWYAGATRSKETIKGKAGSTAEVKWGEQVCHFNIVSIFYYGNISYRIMKNVKYYGFAQFIYFFHEFVGIPRKTFLFKLLFAFYFQRILTHDCVLNEFIKSSV